MFLKSFSVFNTTDNFEEYWQGIFENIPQFVFSPCQMIVTDLKAS
jgi:hypothetical protein